MAKTRSLREIINELLERMVPSVRAAFLASIADITDTAILNEVVKAIQLGDYQQAFRAIGFSPAAMRPMTAALEQAFELGGIATGNTFPKVINTPFTKTVFRFDVRNSRAESYLRDQSSSLVTRIEDDARNVIRNVMHDGLVAGDNPKRTALDIVGRYNPTTGKREGGIIGLTPQMERWQASARAQLSSGDAAQMQRYLTRARRDKRFDKTVLQAIKDGKPLDKATVDRLITRYKDNLLKLRGETIARTETNHSLERSQFEAYMQAVDMGATKSNDVTKTWDTAGDTRVRHDHVAMDGQTVSLLDAFVAPDGSRLMFPGDTSLGASAKETIQCRCVTKYNVDWLADVD